jgi:hypothetical protein
MTVTASTTSFLCVFAPGRSRSRTMVVIPALYPKVAVRWTGFFGSSLGKLDNYQLAEINWVFYGDHVRLDLSTVTGSSLTGQECQRPWITKLDIFEIFLSAAILGGEGRLEPSRVSHMLHWLTHGGEPRTFCETCCRVSNLSLSGKSKSKVVNSALKISMVCGWEEKKLVLSEPSFVTLSRDYTEGNSTGSSAGQLTCQYWNYIDANVFIYKMDSKIW